MMAWRLATRSGDDSTLRAHASEAFAASIAGTTSSDLAIQWTESSAPRARCILQRLEMPRGVLVSIGKCRHASEPGHCLNQDFLPLAVEVSGKDVHSRRVAARPDPAYRRLRQGSESSLLPAVRREIAASPAQKMTSGLALINSNATGENCSLGSP